MTLRDRPSSFRLSIDRRTTRSVIALHGDLDIGDGALFAAVLSAVLGTSEAVDLDFGDLGVFGSAGINAMITARRTSETPVTIVNPPSHIERVLEISGLGIPVSFHEQASSNGVATSRSDFDQLVSTAALSGRESLCITTADLDLPGPEIVFVNAAFCELTGYTQREILGRTPRVLQGPLTDRAMLGRLKRELIAGDIFYGETVNYRRDGTPFFMNWKISPVSTARGSYFVAYQTDNTDVVRNQRFRSANSLLRSAVVNDDDASLVQNVAMALTGAHRILTDDGAVHVAVRHDDVVSQRPLGQTDRIAAQLEALDPGVSVTETDGGIDIAVAACDDHADVRVVVSAISADHLALTSLDDHQALVDAALGILRSGS